MLGHWTHYALLQRLLFSILQRVYAFVRGIPPEREVDLPKDVIEELNALVEAIIFGTVAGTRYKSMGASQRPRRESADLEKKNGAASRRFTYKKRGAASQAAPVATWSPSGASK